MGNKQTVFTHEQLEAYQDCTFFTRKEIMRLFYRYQDLAPQLVPLDYTSYPDVKVPYELIGSMPELKDNPFRQRIAQVFSEDGDGHMTLNNFLDMFSVMSEMAPRDLKAYYAFKIYAALALLFPEHTKLFLPPGLCLCYTLCMEHLALSSFLSLKSRSKVGPASSHSASHCPISLLELSNAA
ncbi:calcium and integrin-binding family member 3 isoform X2 [Lemur catta]|uniref:calcium and integrin-binding family member 3 isoform X2 n=1 Tax=Lemur catta TaxID=9447 RepID=UPI001E268F79|nr:calcium and integrin-binding family member 3 isoform X2 [Lemur catta]